MLIAAVTVLALAMMLAEAWISLRNERALRAAGASEPAGDVHHIMAWVYPSCFVAIGLEGMLRQPSWPMVAAGLAVFACGKAIKYWAIATLGPRWTFRVLVLPRAPLVTRGPYRWLRHPNYLGVIGELAGMALVAQASFTGALSIVAFGYLLRRRIAIEDRALGRQSFTRV